jgi:carboxymethylenebutenolidase
VPWVSASAAGWSGHSWPGEPRLAAAASFYGPLPEGRATPVPANAAVLGRYSEQDERVNATKDAARTALQEAGLTSELVTYPNARHAFSTTPVSATTPTAAAAAYTS